MAIDFGSPAMTFVTKEKSSRKKMFIDGASKKATCSFSKEKERTKE